MLLRKPLQFFLLAQNEQGGAGAGGPIAEPEPQLVEEDPSQPTCAISGESFERMYDPDTDKWYYEDAVVLSGEQAASAGVMEGSIVKVRWYVSARFDLLSACCRSYEVSFQRLCQFAYVQTFDVCSLASLLHQFKMLARRLKQMYFASWGRLA
jgi:hypothetical protein